MSHLIWIYVVCKINYFHSLTSRKVHRAFVVTLTSALTKHGCHTLKFISKFFYVKGKALSGELSCTWTGLVIL